MPKYFFNVRDRQYVVPDHEGTELPDLVAAISEAEASAREILADAIRSGRKLTNRVIDIKDEAGTVVAQVPVSQ